MFKSKPNPPVAASNPAFTHAMRASVPDLGALTGLRSVRGEDNG
jgi:phage tail protein X